MVSALTAVAGLLLALFGVPLIGGSAANRSVADDVGADAVPVPSTSAPSGPPSTRTAGNDAPEPSGSPPPEGWHRVGEPGLTVAFALPDGWVRQPAGELQSTWRSPDGAHDLSVKRDTSYGSTARAASAGQLAWYRRTSESSMDDLEVVTHTTRQNGRDAIRLEMDYHWVGQSQPRKRLEVFVAGEAGRVYQLLVDTAATRRRLAEQRRLFTTARSHLLIDTTA
ncbi:hypothetical protein [Streptomyces sp. NPDC018972]|uniref:hypothetical protein n=1 Tax=Streptomyces sp. NPDC018972 TaxID=3365060 RepID=UPI00378D9117